MTSLRVFQFCKAASALPLSRGFRTDSVLWLRRGGRGNYGPSDEPGIRHRAAVFRKDAEVGEELEHEGELEDDVNIMNLERAYDLNISELKRKKTRLGFQITAKKFFEPRPQPLMLSCNDRECIRYLHSQDPVQWDFKTLSESFPATVETIKKIVKGKWKITPERAKIMDSRAQKNWELLAEGKLEAEPHVLEHLKKFINRKEVLVEQIKSEKFYLPEVKKEKVWNKGEFRGVLTKYERAVEKLVQKTERKEKMKLLENKTSQQTNGTKEEQNSLEVVHKKINETVSRHGLENKDSFIFGEMTGSYSKETTLEDLEHEIMRKAVGKKRLGLLDKAILDSKSSVKSSENHSEAFTPQEVNLEPKISSEGRTFHRKKKKNMKYTNREILEIKDDIGDEMQYMVADINFPDKRTQFVKEHEVGKLLENLQDPAPEQPEAKDDIDDDSDDLQIDHSHPVRIERENIYYDKEVKDIQKTAFWNSGITSAEKAAMELQKKPYTGPQNSSSYHNFASTGTLSTEGYPERINIPKHQQGSGLTFKVKDCYYDDDGQFLYRVPGMTK